MDCHADMVLMDMTGTQQDKQECDLLLQIMQGNGRHENCCLELCRSSLYVSYTFRLI
jgi:hypothetical protein